MKVKYYSKADFTCVFYVYFKIMGLIGLRLMIINLYSLFYVFLEQIQNNYIVKTYFDKNKTKHKLFKRNVRLL